MKRPKRTIAYLVWLEGLKSPIIKGQVIDLLKLITPNIGYGLKIYLLAFQPIYNIILQYKEIKKLKKELKSYGITLIVIPCLAVPFIQKLNLFNAPWYMIPLIWIQAFPALLLIGIIHKIKLFHCRSYPVTYPAILAKKILNAKVIFDPRSPFPEENIVAGNWNKNSLSHRIWKRLEKKYLTNSDVTVAIAQSYVKYFSKLVKYARFAEIPNNVDLSRFVLNRDFREKFRSKIGINENSDGILFVYCGSLGKHWNNIEVYAEFIIKLRELDIEHKTLFVTPNVKELKSTFKQYGIYPEEYVVVSANLDEVPFYLSCGDFGLNLIASPDIRISIKTVEYLAMGLPVIVNTNLLGGQELIKQYGVGLVIDLNNLNLNELKKFISERNDQLSLKCRKLAYEKFSSQNVAKKYAELYVSLLNDFM